MSNKCYKVRLERLIWKCTAKCYYHSRRSDAAHYNKDLKLGNHHHDRMARWFKLREALEL